MGKEDEFAAVVTKAILQAGGDEIQVAVLDDIVEGSKVSGSLDASIAAVKTAKRRPGDFGMEIVGALLIPVLIEAAKQFWAAYVKKLAEKTGGDLAELTVTQAKDVARRIWTGEEAFVSVSDFETLVRSAAKREGLSAEQTDKLVRDLRNPSVANAFEAS